MIQELKFKFKQGNSVLRIVLLNVGVFIVFALVGVILFLFNKVGISETILQKLMLPASLANFIYQPWTLITYMFLHQGFLHLLFNMLWLYWFGNLFQQYLGNTKTYQAYFLGGIFGGLIYILSFNIFPVFANQLPFAYALGASAGVLSIVVATATLLPDYTVFLFLIGPVKLKYIAFVSVILDLISIPNGNAGGHIAHLGGAAFGFIFIKLIYSQSSIPGFFDKIFHGISNLFEPKPKIQIRHKNNNIKVENKDNPSQKEIDMILDKISKNGYESLSKKEKEILFNASKN